MTNVSDKHLSLTRTSSDSLASTTWIPRFLVSIIGCDMFPPRNRSYLPVNQEGEDDSSTRDKPSRHVLYIAVVLLAVITISAYALTTMLPTRTEILSCGNSTEEATERGCSFDIITFSWQVPE